MEFLQLKTEAEVRALIDFHNTKSAYCVLDTETTGLDVFKDRITAIILSGYNPNSACMFDSRFVGLLSGLKPKRLVLHNFKFDYNVLYRAGVDLRGSAPFHDTMLLHHLLDEDASHALDDIVQGEWRDKYKEEFWKKHKNFQDASEEDQLTYACKDVVYTGWLYELLLKRLAADSVPSSLIEHVHKLATALFDTEIDGLTVDLEYLTAVGVELRPSIEQGREAMRALVQAHCESVELDLWAKDIAKLYSPSPRARAWKNVIKPTFNFDSHTQLSALLYEKLKLPVKRNKAGNYTADDKALESLKHLHPIVEQIQDYRGYQKVYTAFIEGTLDRMVGERIYPSFNINGTVTGRISCSNPNMQQLPSKGLWSKVRGIYAADRGHNIVTCDYGQLEVCIAAHYSLDPNLLKIIYEGASKHDLTAEGVGIPRGVAKTLNFAMQYQCTTRKVKEIVGCSDKDAQLIWNKYWETYAKEKEVIDECKAKVDKGEAIVNPFGRRRRFPTTFDKAWHRDAAYRQAYSSLIQGTGADITHKAFYTVSDTMKSKGWGKALFEVHDEIVNMPKQEHCVESSEMLQYTMKHVGTEIGLRVPLSVECSGPLERWEK